MRVCVGIVIRGGAELAEKLYFLDRSEFEHFSIQSGIKQNRWALARMTRRNQRRIAREAMAISWPELIFKSLVRRIFLTVVVILGGRKHGWSGASGLRSPITKKNQP